MAASEAALFAEVPGDHCTETSTFVIQRFRNFMPICGASNPPRIFASPTTVDVYRFVVSLRGEDVEDPAGPREVPVAMAGAINGPEPLACGGLPMRHFGS